MEKRKKAFSLKASILTILTFLIYTSSSFCQMRSPMEEPFIPGHLIIQVKPNVDVEQLVKTLPSEFNFKVNRLLAQTMRAWLIEFDPTTLGQMEAIKMLYDFDEVTIAQNNHVVEIRAVEPDDPQFGNQWHHKNTGQNGGTPGADIKTTEAWDITTGGKNALGHDIVVCILEPVNFNHDDLLANQWVNTAEIPGNGIDDDGNGYIDDINGWNVGNNSGNLPTGGSGHGTNVAGMIGAIGNNGVGVAGANWDVKMMNITGYSANSEASVVSAYEYPLVQRKIYNETNGEAGAFVVSTNASWGVDNANPNNYPIWCAFYDTLGKHGILNCGATTNGNINVDTNGDMPTACSSQYMVGVGRSDRNDNFAGGYGATTINFAAPGIDVRTTANNNGYTTTTGTSFASPLTAGVIALMYSIPCPNFMATVLNDPQLGADLVFHALMDGTDERPALVGNFITGGRLNAKTSIDLLMEETCSACSTPSDLSVTEIEDYSSLITFSENEEAESYNLYYREVGFSQWNTIFTSDNSIALSNLNSCTDYEFYLEVVCPFEVSQPSPVVSFTTSGCEGCIEEEYCEVNVSNPDLFVGVLAPEFIEGPFTGYRPTTGWGATVGDGYVYGELVLVDDGTAAGDEGCDPLINNVEGKIAVARRGSCNFTVKAMNAQNAGAIGIIIVNNAGNMIDMGGNDPDVEIPAIMITQGQGNDIISALEEDNIIHSIIGNQNEFIESFTFDGQIAETGNNNGYLASEVTFQAEKDETLAFTIEPGFDGNPIPYAAQIWIDLNQDGTFNEDELMFTSSITTEEINGDIVIPSSAEVGSTGMRVIMAYQGVSASDFPEICEDFTSGEVEDYCLEILSDEICGFDVDVAKTDPSCSNIFNGEIELVFDADDSETYVFNWSNNTTNASINSGLAAGNYSVVITNENECDTTIHVALLQGDGIEINLVEKQDASCASIANGSIEVEATGGANITYAWIGGNTGASLTDLAPGNYIVTATDESGCSAQASYTIDSEVVLSIEASISDPSCPDTEDGSITATASGGSGITYQWTNGPSSSEWTGIGIGEYEVTATDENGCSIVQTFELISEPDEVNASFNLNQNEVTINLVNNSNGGVTYSWDFGDGNSASSVNATHTYEENGTYTVCLTVFGVCEDDVTCQNVTINSVGTLEQSKDLGIKVFPNPASELLNFFIPVNEAKYLVLLDATGKQVHQSEIKGSETTIEVNNLSNGLYIYAVQDVSGKTLYSSKVSVQK